MTTEVWFRNPFDYVRELVEVGECNVTWDRGLLVKRKIDPIKHAELYFGHAFPWRVLLVGTQGSAEYRAGCTRNKPVAVYPTWSYGEDSLLLEEMLASPIGEHEESCSDRKVRDDERPVLGQEHRVIITHIPPVRQGPGRVFLRYLKDLQEEYPKAVVHVHGLYSWRVSFGMGFGASDVDPRLVAQKGKIVLPSGSVVKFEKLTTMPHWAAALGFKPSDMEVPRNRCIFNIKSALWAGAHYNSLYNFRTKDSKTEIDYTSSDSNFKPPKASSSYITGNVKAIDGDKFICNTCSLQDKCKYFREGAVCTVPGAEPVRLAHMFKSRNVEDILDGLSTLVAANANRLEQGVREEMVDGELNPEVSRIMGQVFDQAAKLAKMHDPLRFAPPKPGVTVNVGKNGASLNSANPRQLVSQVIQGLISQGVPRDQITTEMIQGALEGMIDTERQQKAVTGTVISSKEAES